MNKDVIKILKEPLVYVFTGIYFGASLIKSNYTEIQFIEATFTFLLFGIILTSFIFLISKGNIINKIVIEEKKKEALISIVYFFCWFALFMILGRKILKNEFLSNWIGMWGLLVLLPAAYLLTKGYRLSSFGISKQYFSHNVKITLWSSLIIGAILIYLTPGGKYIRNNSINLDALLIAFGIAFSYAFIFAGFFEEFFFRGVLQTRIAQYFKSDIKGLLLASIIFGLYHLPFQYYNQGDAAGNLMFCLSNVLTEQMIAAPIFGILWMRTQNLLAPVMLHSLIDAISLMPQVIENY